MSMLAPTGLLLPALAMVSVRYDTWLRFVLPLLGLLTAVSVAALVAGVLI